MGDKLDLFFDMEKLKGLVVHREYVWDANPKQENHQMKAEQQTPDPAEQEKKEIEEEIDRQLDEEEDDDDLEENGDDDDDDEDEEEGDI